MKKEIAYLLGYFYADGWLAPNKKYPVIELQEEDGDYLFGLAKKESLTNKSRKRTRKNSVVKQVCFNITSKIYKKLFEDVISDKINMNNVKNYISIEDYPYFLRGFFDGDGNITIRKSSCLMYFYGSYDQDWSFVLTILDSLSIGYNHTMMTRKNGKHKSSFICVSRKDDCSKLFEYMYPNCAYDFGLFRKYEKLLLGKTLVKRNVSLKKRENTFCVKHYVK